MRNKKKNARIIKKQSCDSNKRAIGLEQEGLHGPMHFYPYQVLPDNYISS